MLLKKRRTKVRGVGDTAEGDELRRDRLSVSCAWAIQARAVVFVSRLTRPSSLRNISIPSHVPRWRVTSSRVSTVLNVMP